MTKKTIPEVSTLKGYKYLKFKRTDDGSKKISIWDCCSKSSGEVLGQVKWHGPWRQYCFYAGAAAIFNVSCLLDIEHFIGQLKQAREYQKRGMATAWLGDQLMGRVDQQSTKPWKDLPK